MSSRRKHIKVHVFSLIAIFEEAENESRAEVMSKGTSAADADWIAEVMAVRNTMDLVRSARKELYERLSEAGISREVRIENEALYMLLSAGVTSCGLSIRPLLATDKAKFRKAHYSLFQIIYAAFRLGATGTITSDAESVMRAIYARNARGYRSAKSALAMSELECAVAEACQELRLAPKASKEMALRIREAVWRILKKVNPDRPVPGIGRIQRALGAIKDP